MRHSPEGRTARQRGPVPFSPALHACQALLPHPLGQLAPTPCPAFSVLGQKGNKSIRVGGWRRAPLGRRNGVWEQGQSGSLSQPAVQ